MKRTFVIAAFAALLACGTAHAQQMNIKVGVLTDMASIYADDTGQGAVAAANLAAQDFMKSHKNVKVEVVSADHQNKPDIGSAVAREWIDREGVDMIADMDTSSVALAVQRLATDKGVLTINTGAGSTALTNEQCTPLGIHYAYDTYALAVGIADPVIRAGGDKWFYQTAPQCSAYSCEAA